MTEWLEEVYSLVKEPKDDYAIDEAMDIIIKNIIENIDKLCHECHERQNWEVIDDILNEVDLSRINITLALSFLTITCCIRSKLKSRVSFYNKVKEKILVEDGDRMEQRLARADKLLEGLK